MTGTVTDHRADAFARIPLDLHQWAMAGHGRFLAVGEGIIESEGGPGLLWYPAETFADLVLRIQWRAASLEDNSGVFLRVPPLGVGDPDKDWKPAVTRGYEIQIDDRGHDPEHGTFGSPLHQTGAIYRLAQAASLASRPIGDWNEFEITARGPTISVVLNEMPVARLNQPVGRSLSGHIGLQNHHPGSRMQFRELRVRRL